MPNIVAYFMLFFWPVVAWGLFRAMPIPKAILYTLVLGYLFLPTDPVIDLPVFPAYDKTLVPSLSAAIFAWLKSRKISLQQDIAARRAASASSTDSGSRVRGETLEPWRKPTRRSRVSITIMALVALSLVGCWFTYLGNREVIDIADDRLPALRPYDAAALALGILVNLLPFWIARRHLAQVDMPKLLFEFFTIAGLVYSVLALIEIRLSPQLNTWIYGFFPHQWRQHVRGGSFRPIIFLDHGLRVGMFLALSVMSAAILARMAMGKKRVGWLVAMLWLFAVLFLSRNLGAVLIVGVLLPVILFFSVRLQLLAALAVSLLVLCYPIARGAGVIPLEKMVSVMTAASPDRATSFQFRLDNEDILLERANLKPLAGWGGYGRSRIYNEYGKDVSISDGQWIIVIGMFGWIGYIGQFGLLCLPAIVIFALRRRIVVDQALAGMTIIVAGNLVDLIPNSSLVPPLWMMAGMLWSQIDTHRETSKDDLPLRQEARRAVVSTQRPRIVPTRSDRKEKLHR